MKRIRRKLSDEQLKKFEDAGKKIGTKIKLENKVKKCNSYIEKHRKIALPLIVIGATVILAFNLIISSLFQSPKVTSYKGAISSPISLPEENLSQGYQEILEQNNLITDSIQTLLEKENLTKEDSLYISWGITYLDNLHKQINEYGQENQSQAN